MADTVGEAVIHVGVDDRDVGPGIEKAGKDSGKRFTSGFAGSIKGLAAVAGAALAGAKVIGFARDSIAEARESQKVSAKTVQTIKATGGAANLTAAQVGKLATAISNKTGVDDEAIQSGENLLLTFANVRNEVGKGNDVFSRATKAASDLSAAGFGSITGASVQLGKALNDPVKGISALSRSGVTFTAQQQEQIKTLVESGKTLDAQKIILKAVEGQVGGVAEASATMGEKSAVAFGNIKEAVGTALLPALDAVEGAFVKHIAPAVLDFIQTGGKLGPLFHDIGQGIQVFTSLAQGKAGVSDSNGPIVQLAFRLGELAQKILPQITDFWRNQFLPALSEAGDIFRTQILPAVEELAGAFIKNLVPVLQQAATTFRTVILPALIQLGQYVVENFVPIFKQVADIVVTQVLPTIRDLALFLYGTVYPAIVRIVTAVAQQLKPVFDTLVDVIKRDILPTIQALIIQVRTQLLPALEPLIQKILLVVGVLLKVAAAILSVVLPPLLRFTGFLLKNLIPVIVGLIVIIVKVVDKIIGFGIAVVDVIVHFVKFNAEVIRLVVGAVKQVLQAVADLPSSILQLGKAFLNAGKGIIGKFLDGLKSAGGAAKGIVSGIWGALKSLINNAIDDINNALEFRISIGFGKHVSINPPDIPHLARGTSNFGGGLTWVGEEGPELAVLPPGTQVFSSRQSADRAAAGLGGAGGGIHIGTLVAHDYQDFTKQMHDRGLEAALAGRPV